MKITATTIRAGNVLLYEGDLWVVSKQPEHTKPGKGPAYMQVEMKNLKTGSKLNHRFNSSDYVERAQLEQRDFQYLYTEGENLVLMDLENYEQIQIHHSIAEDKLPFLADNMHVTVESFEERPLSIRLPATVVLAIEQTEPVIKGATATPSYKPAILTNGVRVMVPPYLVTGEEIVVKTEDASFVERKNNMQSPLTSFITTAMQKPSRLLYRDYFEIELSQSSKHMMDAFVSRAYSRTEETLANELNKHTQVGIIGHDNPVHGKVNFSICAIDGMKNLTRSLPFFSISVCAYYVNKDGTYTPKNCVMEFPALGEIYYAEKGRGVLLIKNASANSSIKLKPSTHSSPHMILASEEFAHSIESEKRHFGCFSYEMCLLAAGKADILISSQNSAHFRLVAQLFAEETGCKTLSGSSLIMSNGRCTLEI